MKARVLLVHNHYRSTAPSGEAQVVAAESALLQQHGHTTGEFFRFSDEIANHRIRGTIKGAFSTPWNPFAASAIRRAVDEFLPDVVHVHNTFPLLSPSIFRSIGSRAARVLTLHNYRLFCPAAIPLRNGKVCTECIDRHNVWPAIKFGCYRDSKVATLPLALSVALHRNLGTWRHQVDAFVVFTDFQRTLMIEAGLPENLVHVKPNFYLGEPKILPWQARRQGAVFVGRLSQEKGVESLLRAWILWGESAPVLRIVGDGELRSRLEQMAAGSPQVPVQFLGSLPSDQAQKEIAQSRLLVLPSECYEGFPMVLGEAFAFGTPVAASDIGPLRSIVNEGENGALFLPANPKSLLEVVRNAWKTKGLLEKLAIGSKRSFDSRYTASKNYEMLIDIYQQAIATSRKRKAA